MSRRKKPETIIREANEMAREFYRLMGYVVPKGYRFDQAHHPAERRCWYMVEHVYNKLTATELSEVLNEVEE